MYHFGNNKFQNHQNYHSILHFKKKINLKNIPRDEHL